MSVRPTRRGYAVAVVVGGALAAGSVFGARTLDAVVIPGGVALVAAAVQLIRAAPPTLDRTVSPAEIAGVSRTVTLSLDGARGVPATVRDRLPDDVGVEATTAGGRAGSTPTHATVDAAVGGPDVTYEAVPRRRGHHTVGPTTVAVTDVLGLLRRSFVVDRRDTLVAFPRVGTLPAAVEGELRAASLARDVSRREEFDELREYVRGDSLRDIHWKSSARHDDLLVMEFADRADPERVTIAAGVADGVTGGPAADNMADAAATVCVAVVRQGSAATLETPSGSVDAGPGRIRPALEHLAAAEGGQVPAPDADIVVVAGVDAVSVRIDGRDHRLEVPIGNAAPLRTAPNGVDSGPGPAGGESTAPARPSGEPGAAADTADRDGADTGATAAGRSWGAAGGAGTNAGPGAVDDADRPGGAG